MDTEKPIAEMSDQEVESELRQAVRNYEAWRKRINRMLLEALRKTRVTLQFRVDVGISGGGEQGGSIAVEPPAPEPTLPSQAPRLAGSASERPAGATSTTPRSHPQTQ